MIEHSRAADESHGRFLDPLYGMEQVLHVPFHPRPSSLETNLFLKVK